MRIRTYTSIYISICFYPKKFQAFSECVTNLRASNTSAILTNLRFSVTVPPIFSECVAFSRCIRYTHIGGYKGKHFDSNRSCRRLFNVLEKRRGRARFTFGDWEANNRDLTLDTYSWSLRYMVLGGYLLRKVQS